MVPRHPRRRFVPLTGLLTGFLIAYVPLTAGAQVTTTQRDSWQKVDEILAALQVDEGGWIADVGAGSGFFSFRLSEWVGSSGKVIAQDIDASVLAEVREAAQREGFTNIETVVGAPDDPKLDGGSLDGVLIVNAYHEMREYEAMLAGIRRALKPGGRLVIVDMPPADESLSRRRQTQQHDIAIGIVAEELVNAGFAVIRQVPDFIDEGRHRNWLLVAVAPADR